VARGAGTGGVRPGAEPRLPALLRRYDGEVSSESAHDVLTRQQNDPTFTSVWDELRWRDLVHVSTDEAALKEALDGEPITYYCGFDPTAASLHCGNLLQLLTMRRIQLAGHRPLALVGGSTGLIGDPRPTAERTLNTPETVADWVTRLQGQVSRFLSPDGDNGVRLVNNLDWTAPLSAIDFLRDVGKYFRVNSMLKKDAVAARLSSDAGISYTEFSYQILQGLDYRELFRQYGCTLQTGGSDQWGNLTSGTELIRRSEGESVHALGTPLITNSDGTKFGKSEGNAIWLDPEMTSPYAFYQFWLNTTDADVIARLRQFTFLSRAEIERLEQAVADEPFRRAAQRTLAVEVTTIVHGAEATRAVIDASAALFGNGDLGALDPATLRSAIAELPGSVTLDGGADVARALVDTELVKSLGEARRAIDQGGVYVNNVRAEDPAARLSDLALPGGVLVIRRGKKTLAGVTLS
jgi:tyrosyl-tRNA synthetase